MSEKVTWSQLQQVREAAFVARLANIELLAGNVALLAEPQINPMDKQAAKWVMDHDGRLPDQEQLDLLDRNRWPEPVAERVA